MGPLAGGGDVTTVSSPSLVTSGSLEMASYAFKSFLVITPPLVDIKLYLVIIRKWFEKIKLTIDKFKDCIGI